MPQDRPPALTAGIPAAYALYRNVGRRAIPRHPLGA